MSFRYTAVLAKHENQILVTARHARDRYFPGKRSNFPDWLLIFAVLQFLENNQCESACATKALLTSPETVELPAFERCLSYQVDGRTAGQFDSRGNIEFSLTKLAAAVTYITS